MVLERKPFSLLVNGQVPMPHWRPKWRCNLDRYSFESVKLGRKVEVVFIWEYLHCMVLECDPFVRYYCEYPLEISILDREGKPVKTRPDTWLCFQNAVEQIREVKPRQKAAKAARQIEAQRCWCAKASIEHRVVLSEEHLSGCLVKNCLDIFPYLSKAVHDDARERVLEIIDRTDGCALRDLRTQDPIETDRNYAAALQMLSAGLLSAPLAEQRFADLFLRRRIGALQKPLCEGTAEYPIRDL